MEEDPYAFPDDSDEEAAGASSPSRPVASAPSSSSRADTTADSSTASADYARMAKTLERELDSAAPADGGDDDDGDGDDEEEADGDSDEGIAMDDRGSGSNNEAGGEDDKYPEGKLLWARLKGYSYWPSIVTVDPMEVKTSHVRDGGVLKGAEGPGVRRQGAKKVHVHFIGYANQRAWVPEGAIMDFAGGADFEARAAACPKSRKKDFHPNKRLRAAFDGAIKTAESVVRLSLRDRLKQLGFVYVLVSPKAEQVKTPAQRKFPSNAPPAAPTSSSSSPMPGASNRKRKQASSSASSSASPKKRKRVKKEKDVDDASDKSVTKRTKIKSEDDDEEKPPPVLISTPTKSEEIRDVGAHAASAGDSSTDLDDDLYSDPGKTGADDDDEEGEDHDPSAPHKLGSLVWGCMVGFPYWPCFVTRDPNGAYVRRAAATGRTSYHVQFFNWNDESAWVPKTLPWCTLEEFKQKASRQPKTSKDFHPKRSDLKKWVKAYEEAHRTAHLSRRDRHDRRVVFYRDERGAKVKVTGGGIKPIASAISQKTPVAAASAAKARPPSSVSRRSSASRERSASRSSTPKRRRPGPKCKRGGVGTGGDGGTSSQRVALDSVLLPEDLPPGWTMERTGKGKREFTSPEGTAFASLREVVGHLFRQNSVAATAPTPSSSRMATRKRSASFCGGGEADEDGESSGGGQGWFIDRVDSHRFRTEEEGTKGAAGSLDGPVTILRDGALPAEWALRRERHPPAFREEREDRLVFVAPDDDLTFSSRWEAAAYLEPKGHPALELESLLGKSVKRCAERRRRILQRRMRRLSSREEGEERERQDGDGEGAEDEDPFPVIDLKSVTAQDILDHPLLGKTVIPTFVEMVKLPDVFLDHPSVRVREENNEMVITDVDTEDFIAKKIIYD